MDFLPGHPRGLSAMSPRGFSAISPKGFSPISLNLWVKLSPELEGRGFSARSHCMSAIRDSTYIFLLGSPQPLALCKQLSPSPLLCVPYPISTHLSSIASNLISLVYIIVWLPTDLPPALWPCFLYMSRCEYFEKLTKLVT